MEAHLIQLADENTALTSSPPGSPNEQYSTAEMDLVSENSYHPAEDDPAVALPVPSPQPQPSQHFRPSIRPSSRQITIRDEASRRPRANMVVEIPRLSPPMHQVPRRTSPRAGQKHRRQVSDTLETPFDLRRSPTRATIREAQGRQGQERRPGAISQQPTARVQKRSKRLF